MKKYVNIAALVVAAFAIIALSALIVNVGLELAAENEARAEEYQLAQETEVAEIPEEPEPEPTLKVHTPAIHPAGFGGITWYYTVEGEPIDHDEVTTSSFEISPEGDVDFTQGRPTDESVYNRLVSSIQRKHKEESRAIHVMEGYMNDDLSEGTMQWISHDRVRGEMRFTYDESGTIIFNASDWAALPETDEQTEDDFQSAAERMLKSWGAYNR